MGEVIEMLGCVTVVLLIICLISIIVNSIYHLLRLDYRVTQTIQEYCIIVSGMMILLCTIISLSWLLYLIIV